MKYRAIIRHGAMSHVDNFRADFSGLRMGDNCVIRTERGIEHGRILSPVGPYTEEDKDAGIGWIEHWPTGGADLMKGGQVAQSFVFAKASGRWRPGRPGPDSP